MIDARKFERRLSLRLSNFCLLLLLAASTLAQTPAESSQSPRSNGEAQHPQSKIDVQDQDQRISPKEADDLFRDVDEILKFASKDTNLPIKHEVKRKLTTRDEVVAYLQKSMAEAKDAKRLRRSELVLKKFGLLPSDFDLQSFLVALLREQVAGYYDAKTQTVNLLDWIGVEQQRPVLAHELTHALQDQSFGLEKWMKTGDTDLDDKKNLSIADVEKDEISEARQAVVEGQAMVVLLDYMLAPTGQSLLTSPQIANAIKTGMLVGAADSPEFQNAPVFLKEALTFPYRYGLDFEAELLRSGGKAKAFAAAFANPPQTTRQIMEPNTYLSGERFDSMRLPDFKEDFKGYDRFDIGAMGEFDVAVLVDQYAGVQASHDIYPRWRGGYYYAARPKGDPSAPLALLYVSRWSSPETAASFAAIYAKSLAKRYKHVHEATEDGKKPMPDAQTLQTLTGTHTWLTENGPVVVAVQRDLVLITESLDESTTQQLQRELFQLPAAK